MTDTINPAFDKTKTRYRVLRTVVQYSEENPQRGISMDEIADQLQLSGRPAVHYHVHILLEEGFLKKANTAHRYLRPTNRGRALVEILESEE